MGSIPFPCLSFPTPLPGWAAARLFPVPGAGFWGARGKGMGSLSGTGCDGRAQGWQRCLPPPPCRGCRLSP